MKLSDLNEWLTLAANLGVLAGIVFLALEIQQNTDAVRSSTIQGITNVSMDVLRAYAADHDLAELRLKGEADPSSLSEVEAFQYFSHNRQYWLHFQNVYLQHQLGVLGDDLWRTYHRIVCADFDQRPGLRSTWSDHSSVLDPRFVALVES